MNKKQFLYDYMNTRLFGVLSTMGPGEQPQGAVMEFAQTKKLELIFYTLKRTRKYTNIKNNPRVAFVIGWEKGTTIQYEGTARELQGGELVDYKKIHHAKHASFGQWDNQPDIVYFVVTPMWIRYSAMGDMPWELQIA